MIDVEQCFPAVDVKIPDGMIQVKKKMTVTHDLQVSLKRPRLKPAPAGSGWLHEVRHDGYRIIARKDGGRVTLWTRHEIGMAVRAKHHRFKKQ